MIPYIDLKAQHRDIRDELTEAIGAVIDSAQFVLGPAVERFEGGFAEYCGARHAIGVNSGTTALHMALLALDIGAGDEVIVPAHTFIATAFAVRYVGAKPVLVDIDPDRLTMLPSAIEAAVTARTRAVIPVHMHGQMADMDPIMEIAARRGLAVIEDAAQAVGASYKGRPAGSVGAVGCFSFYPAKNLGACGEGGALVTSDDALARRLRGLRDWGQLTRGVHELPGYNFRMDGIQGAALGVKLRHLPAWTEARQRIAAEYDRAFARAASPRVVLPRPCPDGAHVYHHYAIRTPDRDALRRHLDGRGVQTAIHYALPVHLQPCLADLGLGPGTFPNAEAATAAILSLPIYPELAPSDVQRVVDAVVEGVHANG